jgi:hypothetical protein
MSLFSLHACTLTLISLRRLANFCETEYGFCTVEDHYCDYLQHPPTVIRTSFGRLLLQFKTEYILFIPTDILEVIYMVGANNIICSLFLGLKTMTDFSEYGINLRVQQIREVPC